MKEDTGEMGRVFYMKKIVLGFKKRELGLLGFNFWTLKIIPFPAMQLGTTDFIISWMRH